MGMFTRTVEERKRRALNKEGRDIPAPKYTHERDWAMESNKPILSEERDNADTVQKEDGLTFRRPL